MRRERMNKGIKTILTSALSLTEAVCKGGKAEFGAKIALAKPRKPRVKKVATAAALVLLSEAEPAQASHGSAQCILCSLFLLCAFSLLPGCGSGGSGSGGITTPIPTVSSLSPSSATPGGSSFTLTVNGSNFTASGSTVKWNGTSLTTT